MAALVRAQSLREPCKLVVYFLFMVNYRVGCGGGDRDEADCRVPPTQQRRNLVCLGCGALRLLLCSVRGCSLSCRIAACFGSGLYIGWG